MRHSLFIYSNNKPDPFLLNIPTNSSCANFIINNEIGYACNAEDYQGLADMILKLKETDLRVIGIKSKEAYLNKYSKEKFVKKLLDDLHF